MKSITKKLKKISKSKDNQTLIYKQKNKNRVGLFVDDLSTK